MRRSSPFAAITTMSSLGINREDLRGHDVVGRSAKCESIVGERCSNIGGTFTAPSLS
jgi:hypothetical protein